ncbi:hypothetical protein PPROV_000516700 [Pycnococcus provasolii]|uniref:Tyr recombinase domain-containing protein n=1 Tax=Pycnococcus provasolii TaxID=41880 RepID=A0A830HHZ0_9CHLO|nr:hypothetical protein PPROV_000516700 [Pycnococcus provasolii]
MISEQTHQSLLWRSSKQCGFDPPALGADLDLARKGWEQRQTVADPSALPPNRVPIPPTVMRAVLQLGLDIAKKNKTKSAHCTAAEINTLRDCAALTTSYLFFNRGDIAHGLLWEPEDSTEPDLRIDAARSSLLFLERRFKGKSQLLTKRLLVLDCSDKKECLDLLQAYLDVRQHVRGCKHFWELPSSKRWLASSIDDMLQRVLKLLPHHVPPPGCTWTGHSLRSGAASAGYAVTKDLLVICHYGGWARGSDVMQDDYIDPSWRSTPDARFFFGWLKSAL